MVNLSPTIPNTPRIFVDSSVLMAACGSRTGASHAVLFLGSLGLLQLVVIPYVFVEVERNLAKKLPQALPEYEYLKLEIPWEINPMPSLAEITKWLDLLPLKDVPILVGAALSKPNRLVTLDTKHFIDPPQVAELSGLKIVTPALLMQEIRAILAMGFDS